MGGGGNLRGRTSAWATTTFPREGLALGGNSACSVLGAVQRGQTTAQQSEPVEYREM